MTSLYPVNSGHVRSHVGLEVGLERRALLRILFEGFSEPGESVGGRGREASHDESQAGLPFPLKQSDQFGIEVRERHGQVGRPHVGTS